MDRIFFDKISKITGIQILENQDLKDYSRMKLTGSTGDIVRVMSITALKELLSLPEIPLYRIIGMGSNQVYPSTSSQFYLLLNLNYNENFIDEFLPEYELPASVPVNLLVQAASKHGLKGWQILTGIPGTLGGAVYMNAGTELGEISSLIKEVRIISKGGVEKLISIPSDTSNSNINKQNLFSYRKNHFCEEGDVIYQVTITHGGSNNSQGENLTKELKPKRASTQVTNKPIGSNVFKNIRKEIKGAAKLVVDNNLPKRFQTFPAGRYIELLNLKGFTYNGVRISSVHGNFIENFEDGSYADFCELVRATQLELKMQFGLDFELEVKTV